MIERLAAGVRELAHSRGARLRGDCADAVRLELDCPQQMLTAAQRVALCELSDVLEQNGESGAETIVAARRACIALGLAIS
jgi:hypothetical protein